MSAVCYQRVQVIYCHQRLRFGTASAIARSGIEKYFSGIFLSEIIGFAKPMKQYFDYIFSKIEGFDKKSALMVGDSLESDIAGAVTAGIDTCWFNPKGLAIENQSTYIIERLENL